MIARQELQTRLHELSEKEMKTVLQFIERVSTSAIRLQILVDETSAKVNQMGSFGLFDTLLLTASRLAGVAVLVLALGITRKAVAVAVVVGAGIVSVWSTFRVLTLTGPGLTYTACMISWSTLAQFMRAGGLRMRVLDPAVSDGESSTLIPGMLELAAQPLKVSSMLAPFVVLFFVVVMVVQRHWKASATDGPTLPHSSTEPVPRLKECLGQRTSSPGG